MLLLKCFCLCGSRQRWAAGIFRSSVVVVRRSRPCSPRQTTARGAISSNPAG